MVRIRGRPLHGPEGELLLALMTLEDVSSVREERDRERFLEDATRELGRSLDYATTLRMMTRLTVPRLADWCAVEVFESPRALVRGALAHSDSDRERWVAEDPRRFPSAEPGPADRCWPVWSGPPSSAISRVGSGPRQRATSGASAPSRCSSWCRPRSCRCAQGAAAGRGDAGHRRVVAPLHRRRSRRVREGRGPLRRGARQRASVSRPAAHRDAPPAQPATGPAADGARAGRGGALSGRR